MMTAPSERVEPESPPFPEKVQDLHPGGTPTLSGNTITSGGVGITYTSSGGGTASSNVIVFSGTQGGRIGIAVSDSAVPILNGAAPAICPGLDIDGGGTVTIDELIIAVNHVLDGCAP
jgi:parallel beta-helix repeat protein